MEEQNVTVLLKSGEKVNIICDRWITVKDYESGEYIDYEARGLKSPNELNFQPKEIMTVNIKETPEEKVRALYRMYLDDGLQSEATAISVAFKEYGVNIAGIHS